MPDTPTDAEMLEEAYRLSGVLTQSGAVNATVNEPADSESPEVYYSYGGKDYIAAIQPL